MSPERFEHLLSLVGPLIKKNDTNFRKAIPVAERLMLTLRFFASGDSQRSMSFLFLMGKKTVSRIISETSEAIVKVLQPIYMSPPSSSDDWKKIAAEFEEIWQFPHVLGAIDGKHVQIEAPAHSGTLYHNYKGFFSIVLLAICDAKYNFILVDVGQYGSNNDSGVLAHSAMGNAFENNTLNLPENEKFGEKQLDLPYFLLGDEIFPLKPWLMRPYPGNLPEREQVYNYRHSRARRVIENSFGILRARWRIFSRPIIASVENTESYIMACLCLHNYLRQTDNAMYCPSGFVDSYSSTGEYKPGAWRKQDMRGNASGLRPVAPAKGCRSRATAVEVREALKEYVNSESGLVSWQLDHVRSV